MVKKKIQSVQSFVELNEQEMIHLKGLGAGTILSSKVNDKSDRDDDSIVQDTSTKDDTSTQSDKSTVQDNSEQRDVSKSND